MEVVIRVDNDLHQKLIDDCLERLESIQSEIEKTNELYPFVNVELGMELDEGELIKTIMKCVKVNG